MNKRSRYFPSVILVILVLLIAPRAHAGKFSDFGGDGKSDIFWRNSATGQNYILPMNGKTILGGEGYVRTVADANWRVVGIGNFDGAGGADLLWRNDLTGESYVYLMQGTAIVSEGYLRAVPNLYWQVAGVGDFDGDGKDDIVWRNLENGENYVYFMDGLSIKPGEGYLRTVLDSHWQIAGIADFDGDGRADILWRNLATGENYLYLMNGLVVRPGEGYLRRVASLDWRIAGVGDFNGDGRADILWRNESSGENYLYLMNGLAIGSEGYLRTVSNLDWQIAGVGDFDGDGRSDILWRNAATGENYVYLMSGMSILDEGYTRTVAQTQWNPVGRTPLAQFDVLPMGLDTAQHLIDLTMGTHVLPIWPVCTGSYVIDCPGGVPRDPPSQVSLTRTAVSVTPTADPAVYAFSVEGSVDTLNNISVRASLPGYGTLTCSVGVDTTRGSSPIVRVSGTARFGRHSPGGPVNRADVVSINLSGLESVDVSASGSTGLCALAKAALVFFEDMAVEQVERVLRGNGLCGAPGAPVFIGCPPRL